MNFLEIFGDGFDTVKSNLRGKLPNSGGDTVKNIVNWILWAAGALAVVMIIVSGIQMITSAGNAGAVQKAKQTLIYSVVGLIIVVLAYAIVTFVVGKVA